MKFQFFLFLFFLFILNGGPCVAQDAERERLFFEASQVRFTEPEKSLKLYDYLLKSSSQSETVAIEIRKLGIYRTLGDYVEAVNSAQKIWEGISQISEPSLKFEFFNELSALYYDLDFGSEGKKLRNKAQAIYESLPVETQRQYAVDLQVNLIDYKEYPNYKSKIKDLLKIVDHFQNDDVRKSLLLYKIGNIYEALQSDSATVYYAKAMALKGSSLPQEETNRPLEDLYPKTVEAYNKNTQRILLRRKIEYWEEGAPLDSLIKYHNLLQDLEQSIQFESRKAKVILLQNIYRQKKIDVRTKHARDRALKRQGIIIMLLLFLLYIAYKWYVYKRKIVPVDEDTVKTINIPDRTEVEILEKLKHFENSELFLDKHLRLADLAKHLDTNTRYLSSIINSAKNKSFNSYVNSLRIKYIVNKLNSDPKYLNYKISYLAEDSGFASQSSFTTAFKEVTGKTPSSYIKMIRAQED